jgi:hypothetical protein
VDLVDRLEDLPDVGTLMDLLRTAAPPG